MDLLLFENLSKVKPFLKWAGGKSQLIPEIEKHLPHDFKKKEITYIEPFVGSGAVMFWMLKNFPNIEYAIINDINSDLCRAFQTIKNFPESLITLLSKLEIEYNLLKTEEERRLLFLGKRKDFNVRNLGDIEHTALLIFLNKTCFNGLFRVNSKNQFNVPFGKYDKPKICDAETIFSVSNILKKVTILNGDYSKTIEYVQENTFFYFDPPYRPLNKTSSFNSYSNEVFDDNEQIRLKNFCDTLTQNNHKWLLSNSDPQNIDPNDVFFDELYKSDSIKIDRVMAKRQINSISSKRGQISELLIYNYEKNII